MSIFSRLSSLLGKGQAKLNQSMSATSAASAQTKSSNNASIGVASDKLSSATNSVQTGMQSGVAKVNDWVTRGSNWLNKKITSAGNFIGQAQQSFFDKVSAGQNRAQNFLNNAQAALLKKQAEHEAKKRQQAAALEEVKNNLGVLWQTVKQLPSDIKNAVAGPFMDVQQKLSETQEQIMSQVSANSDILGGGGLAQASAEQGAPNAVA